jgi:hypothetical protein
MVTQRIRWAPVIEQAAEIVNGYDTGVTLRQLFYRLITKGTIPNTDYCYQRLSRLTAKQRREETFPDLIDPTRRVREFLTFDGSLDALEYLHGTYRRDRTEWQEVSVYLGVEKHGLAAQLSAWFGSIGFPILTLGGWSSQSFIQEVQQHLSLRDRPSIFLYAGDFDPSGWFIADDFVRRVAMFDQVERIALNPDQIGVYGLEENAAPEKSYRDSRARAFAERFGSVRQVELDAFEPETLRDLYVEAFSPHWDPDGYRDSTDQEETEREEIAVIIESRQD